MLSSPARRARRAALAVALLLPAACACPPLVEGYASPEDTLLAWQAHLCRDDAQGEYGCLSAGFQRAMGGFPTYHAARAALLEEQPATAWLFARSDLLDHITASERDERAGRARLTLSSGDDLLIVRFERETWLVITWDDGRREAVNQDHQLAELLGSQLGRQWLTIVRPPLQPEQLEHIRALAVEPRWKIAEIGGLGPTTPVGTPPPGTIAE